ALAYQWLHNPAKASAASERELFLLEEYVKQHPTDAFGHSALAVLYAGANQRERAVARLGSARGLARKDPQVLADAADTWGTLGHRQRALHYLEDSLKNGSTLDDLRARFGLQQILSDPKFRPNPK